MSAQECTNKDMITVYLTIITAVYLYSLLSICAENVFQTGPQTIIYLSSGNSHIRFNSYYTLFSDRAEVRWMSRFHFFWNMTPGRGVAFSFLLGWHRVMEWPFHFFWDDRASRSDCFISSGIWHRVAEWPFHFFWDDRASRSDRFISSRIWHRVTKWPFHFFWDDTAPRSKLSFLIG